MPSSRPHQANRGINKKEEKLKKIHKVQLKVLLKEYKMMCVEAIADGDFKKAQKHKQTIREIKDWLKRNKAPS